MPGICDRCAIEPCNNRDPDLQKCREYAPMIVYTVTDSESFKATMDWILSEDD